MNINNLFLMGGLWFTLEKELPLTVVNNCNHHVPGYQNPIFYTKASSTAVDPCANDSN